MTEEEAKKELLESLNTLSEYDIANSSRLKNALKIAVTVLEERTVTYSEAMSLQYAKGYQDGFLKAKEIFEESFAIWKNNQNGTFTCSKCGCKHSASKFCPDCGTRMFMNMQKVEEGAE